uniref:RNA-directed DNA polymerase n=2 Tax=Anopheles gambiae TaxID=7165 RepID=A0A0E4G8R6_ANOGA
MLLNLQRYNLSIKFVSGKENVVADALSRAPDEKDESWDQYKKLNIYKIFEEIENIPQQRYLKITDNRLKEISEETKKDQTLQTLIQYIQRGWPDEANKVPDSIKIYFGYRNELSVENDLIFRGDRILIPQIIRRKLIDCCHISHNGVEATLKLARANIFWPGMNSQIKDVIKNCTVCNKFSDSQPNPPMMSHDIPTHPFQMISMDVFFAEYRGAKKNFLVTVDHYSDFFEVNILKDMSPQSVISVCKENFARHGRPQRIITDNGTNFVNKQMLSFAKQWDFEHVTSAPHHQQSNGKAEAAVKIAKRLLKKAQESDTDFWYALLNWRNIPNKIGSSPAARLFSRSTKCSVPCSDINLLPKIVENVPTSIEKHRKKAKEQYDKKTRRLPDLEIGSPVFVQLTPETSKQWTPGKVSERLNSRSYVVDVHGRNFRRSLVHLKPRTASPTCTSSQEDNVHPCEYSSPAQLLDEPSQNQPHDRPRRNTTLPSRLKDYVLN